METIINMGEKKEADSMLILLDHIPEGVKEKMTGYLLGYADGKRARDKEKETA